RGDTGSGWLNIGVGLGQGFVSAYGGYKIASSYFPPPTGTPVQFAESLQGRNPYAGVDRFRNITLKEGTTIYGGAPGQSNYYTTASGLQRSGGSASNLFRGLQVERNDLLGYRPGVTAYRVTQDVPAAFGRALANPQHGTGKLPQIVLENYKSVLQPLYSIPLKP
ncbi:MAG: hypothetical protein K8S55_12775, partial [Phycisphaerae bacterium]|nr:hypothetical protein [Phycisphaerae bacterium]